MKRFENHRFFFIFLIPDFFHIINQYYQCVCDRLWPRAVTVVETARRRRNEDAVLGKMRHCNRQLQKCLCYNVIFRNMVDQVVQLESFENTKNILVIYYVIEAADSSN